MSFLESFLCFLLMELETQQRFEHNLTERQTIIVVQQPAQHFHGDGHKPRYWSITLEVWAHVFKCREFNEASGSLKVRDFSF